MPFMPSVSNKATVTKGTSAPTTTPKKVGDIYVDTANKRTYTAMGTSSSGDWKKVMST